MKMLIIAVLSLVTLACASTKELTAPCTYEDRQGCGELIYTHLAD